MSQVTLRKRIFLLFYIDSFASLLDLHGTCRSPIVISDAAAMRADWTSVGDDLRVAMEESLTLLPDEVERAEVAELVET
jgi:hypothetical protein